MLDKDDRWSASEMDFHARTLCFVAVLSLLSAGCAGTRREHDPSSYACPLARGPVVVDGVLDEEAWRDAEVIREFRIPGTRQVPVHATEGRIMWDEQFLYVAFDATDPDIRSVFTERDSDTYRDDVLEVFFKTAPEAEAHYSFEINPLGAVRDEYHTPARRFQTGWDCAGIKVGAKVAGTLNDPKDRDERWQLEIAIPFASLPCLKGRAPEPGDVWLFHLARIDRSVDLKDGKELTSTAPLETNWFHNSEHWLPLIFVTTGTPARAGK